jgi:hypothetical protein
MHLRYGNASAGERRHHTEFTVYRVGRWQQRSRRLAPKDVAAISGNDAVGRVRLPALELLYSELARKRGDVPAQISSERVRVDRMNRGDERWRPDWLRRPRSRPGSDHRAAAVDDECVAR